MSRVRRRRGFVANSKNFALGGFWEFSPLLFGKTTSGAGVANARHPLEKICRARIEAITSVLSRHKSALVHSNFDVI